MCAENTTEIEKLAALVDILDELEGKNSFAFEFITNVQIRQEENERRKISEKEIAIIIVLYEQYINTEETFF